MPAGGADVRRSTSGRMLTATKPKPLPLGSGCYHIKAYEVIHGRTGNSLPYVFYAMLEAVNQVRRLGSLQRLEKYREARENGISFYDIDWDDE